MSESNKAIVEKVNTAFAENKMEDFLSECADDLVWNMVGENITTGKDKVREYMASMDDMEPPKFTVAKIIAEGDSIVCWGDMSMKGQDGVEGNYSYCDVYEFSAGKITRLDSYVVKQKTGGERSDKAAA